MFPLLAALAIPDDSDEPRPLPPPKFHGHRHHHHLGPSFRLLELERKFDAAKTAVVDVGICGAIPLLEKHADYCSKKEDDTERILCIKRSLGSNIGGSSHEKVLLRQLLGVILLSAAAPFSDTDRQREMGDSQLEAWDYLGTTERQIEAESDVDMRSSIARLMGVGGSSTAKSQLYGTIHQKKIEGDVVKEEGGTTFTRQLELGRVKRGSLMSKLTSYSAHEEVELVEAMMGELERLYTLLTQAIQREQVRLQLAAAKAAEKVEWGEFQTAPQNLI